MANMTNSTPPSASRSDWFLLTLCGLSLTANVLLGIGYIRLSSGGATVGAGVSPPRASGPAVGVQLPPLEAERLGGGPESVRYADGERPTIVYVFTPSCQWCARNLANLKALTAHAKSDYRVVGVSLDPNVEDYVAKMKFDFPVYVNAAPEVVTAYGMGPTPQTLVVSPSGKVLKSWIGAYAGATEGDVEATFGLTLPGLVH